VKVPVTFFCEAAAGSSKASGNINEALQLVRTFGTLRLLRAFEKMDVKVSSEVLCSPGLSFN
jgi:hypothetical protein